MSSSVGENVSEDVGNVEDVNEAVKESVSPRARVSKVAGTRVPTPTPPPPEIPDEVRNELTAIMQDLLLKTHELSFEYSTIDCPQLSTCPLAQKSRELFKVVKELNNLVKRVSTTPPPKQKTASQETKQA
ncbi:MAG: hypothetical protein ACPLZG_09415 [Thermoproteota archaeon]|jgi:hypothetical protein